MAAMADTTWNRKVRWQQIKKAHFEAAYGPDAAWVQRYLARLEKLVLERPLHNGIERMEMKQPRQLRAIEAYLTKHAAELLTRSRKSSSPVFRESLDLLAHQNTFLLMRSQVIQGKLDPEVLNTWLLKSEKQVHPFLDIPALIIKQLQPPQPIY
jgi:hypothetical protein